MSNKMIERVARAINKIYIEATDENWQRYRRDDSWKQHVNIAKAAIQAMREPTEEMINSRRGIALIDDSLFKLMYQDMIDAALKE